MAAIKLVEHDSQNEFYRKPFGAVSTESEVMLRLRVSAEADKLTAKVHVWQDRSGETIYSMSPLSNVDGNEYYISYIPTPKIGTLLWYYFIIELDGHTYYYCNQNDGLGGMGQLYDDPRGSFQITVYNKGAKTPDWFKHSVMYQIFPDRFYRQGNTIVEKKNSLYHASWKDKPHYFKDPDTGDVIAYDFFGGNFAGIKAKLPYLKDMGISVVYLNPIFESASNHHYDTADYHKADPILGTNDEFAELCAEAKKQGIRFILDGVFSHTGEDSKYFNKFGNYDTVGACQSQESPYYSWYSFNEYPHSYESWWGFANLPNVKEETPAYMDFIINDENSVLHYWNKQGISGWRLDVVDELPEAFSQAFYKELKKTDPDSVLIGEVWEDASNKNAYGVNRHYLCGYELDSAMNYPFRKIVLDFLLGQADAWQVNRRIRSLQENYPAENFYAMMNLLGSHDRERILTLLGEAPSQESMPDREQARYQLDPERLKKGRLRLKLAVMWQMLFPGVPSVYYGDEIGMQGYRDPYCRCPYDWENGDLELQQWHKELIALRNKNIALQTGKLLSLYADGDVYGFARVIDTNKDVFGEKADNDVFIVLLNRSHEARRISVDVRDLAAGSFVDALGNGKKLKVMRGRINIELPAFAGVVYRKQEETGKYPRQCGVLLHPTSLPSDYGVGDFGPAAYDFVDFLAKANQKIWQLLPLTPVDYTYSPYQSPSAFAGNTMLVSPEKLAEYGWLTDADIKLPKREAVNRTDYDLADRVKPGFLKKAGKNFFAKATVLQREAFEAYCHKEAYWLDEYALFKALKAEFNDANWTEWPEAVKHRDAAILAEYRKKLSGVIRQEKFEQYMFTLQRKELKYYANEHGIKLLGDMPIFIALDSADAWANQKYFKLDQNCKPYKIAGVPPDYFSATGQLWGNPQYNWEAMQADNYDWWLKRIQRTLDQVDIVRIDHFRGFEAYWEIDGDAENAINGIWRKGPGKPFFDLVKEKLGDIAIVAEDLGIITDEVEELREACGFPGMKVLHFELHFNDQKRIAFVAPENSLIYTGTHDNNTTVGWLTEDADFQTRSAVAAMLGKEKASNEELCQALIEYAYASPARIAIVPVWDLLSLDGQNRMNLPGTTGGNWCWRMLPGALTDTKAEEIRQLTEKYNR